MAALSADRDTARREGMFEERPVKADTKIYAGSIVMMAQATGYVQPGADTTGMICKGIAQAQADNTDGAAGAINARCRYGTYLLGSSGMSVDKEGSPVYASDDQTVALKGSVSNHVGVGVILEYVSATSVWVKSTPETIAIANNHTT